MVPFVDVFCLVIQSFTFIVMMVYMAEQDIWKSLKNPLFIASSILLTAAVGVLQRMSEGIVGIVLMIILFLCSLMLIANYNVLFKDALISVMISYFFLGVSEVIVLFSAAALGVDVAWDYPMNWTTVGVYFFVPIVLYIIFRLVPLLKLKKELKRFQFSIVLLATISTTFVSVFGLFSEGYIFFYKVSNKVTLLIAFIAIVILIIEEMSERRRNEQFRYYETYLPIVEEMINNVQMTQHSYNNHIMTLRGLLDLDVDNQKMKDAIYKLTKNNDEGEKPDYNILHVDNKLLAGLLYQKMLYAEKNGYRMHFTIQNNKYESKLSDFDVIDVTGIMIDNAIEHCGKESNDIYVTVGQAPNSNSKAYRIRVENAGPDVTNAVINSMFKKGSTTKTDKVGHGFGMYILRSKVNKNKGKVSVSNTNRDGVRMIAVEIEV
ncbi:MAG: GHKL domain-containing protein [Lachnospiraceae bacterium]|nr:GHKL domain-containing protein [Lachnospiraceae bacterium]